MVSDFFQKFGHIARNCLPMESALILLLLSVVIWPIPFAGPVSPSFVFVAVYYWAIYRPDLFRHLFVFFLGLLNDVMHFLPFGLSALVFLGVYQLAYAHRRYFVGQIFYMLWVGFALLLFLAMALMWGVLSISQGEFMTVTSVAIQYAITVALFPFPAWALIWLQRNFLSQGT
ncbi:MAG: rod shape-determining protein MreD [Alphaproteobacteria bacterium]|nr:rod shape-determining protein MreD [Alphaproteobacteria bacterium]